ncbi:hypothetical protein HPO96_26165 [Kribbella sandramycini]|uniref:Ricin B lectin domain-containing protein n=1 Tax=Kribbella sandramycini TaxID=60450 RepID=A0A7Y4L3P5_9ACTN|nr:RICIN domain-containing protein [Kribbella sandramycini]MBB6570593.1 hypothetical protein [Kribbella sandramycini]NOL43739.1 hypothetical protein [Kribbella sandramycini]
MPRLTAALVLAAGLLVVPVAARNDAARAASGSGAQATRPGSFVAVEDGGAEARAMATARRTGRPVELAALRSETGQVFANPDGTKTMEQHAGPVRVRRGADWVAVDPTLVRERDGRIRPKAAVLPIALSGGGSRHLLTIGCRGAALSLGWPGRLPAPSLAGDTATYAEVLPGVDLQVRVGVDRFSHLLVVKSRDAARNPALRRLNYPVTADGVRLDVRRDGTTVAKTPAGKTLYTAEPPRMWDAAQRTARVGIQQVPGQFRLTPELGLLSDPKAKFPLFIDPSFAGTAVDWLHVNERSGQVDGWTYDRDDEGAKVGRAYRDTANLYRSMFLMNTSSGTQSLGGTTILSATFRITLNKTPTSTATPVELWQVNDLDPSNRGLHWGTTSGYWQRHLDTQNGEAWPEHEDNPMEFGGGLQQIVQAAADGRRPGISLGLKAPNETTSAVAQNQWKKFHPHTALLAVKYNSTPKMPKGLTFSRPLPCGTSTAPARVNTTRPQWAAVANDPDLGDNVTTRLRVRDAGGAVVHESSIGPTVSGAAFTWPEVPAGVLNDGQVYSYTAVTTDTADASSPETPPCHFVIDTAQPEVPRVSSTDFPDGTTGPIKVRTTGTVTFRPGGTPAETDIVEYRYGTDNADVLTNRVKAAADGSAVIPLTIHPQPGLPAALRLYVQAVDRAGNVSETRKGWDAKAAASDVTPARVRADSNGDGKADVTAVFDHGFGRTGIWNLTSTGSGFHPGVMTWDTGEGTGFSLAKVKPVQGDFNGDGRSDMAVFRVGAGQRMWLYPLPADGNTYLNPEASWMTSSADWSLATARVVAGDVDGDQKDDIVVQTAGSGDDWQALVFRSSDGFRTPVRWVRSAAGNPWSNSTPLIADVDGDGKADLLSVRNLTGCRTTVDLYKSTGSAFGTPTTVYDSAAGQVCWEKNRFAVADPDGDGRDDIVALYELAPSEASVLVLRSDGSKLTRSEWQRTDGLALARTTLVTGDYDGDRKEDVGLLYAVGEGDREVYTLRSTGTAFAGKVKTWSGAVGAVTGPKFDIEHRQYELVNKNSGKCLNVHHASTADLGELIQYRCLPVELNARFRLMPVPGTDQYSVRPVHTAVDDGPIKCADVFEGRTDDDTRIVQYPCGGGQGDPFAWQQVTFDYVDGSAYDTVVQLKFAHSGKCLDVDKARLDDTAPATQKTCGQATSQQWILRPAFNATQLGGANERYRTTAATGPAVLDVTDCRTGPESEVRMWEIVEGSKCQAWKLDSLGDDIYRIVDPTSGHPLTIQGCSRLPRATVYLFPVDGSDCQKWRIEPTPGGTYSVVAVSTGMSLDVAGCRPDIPTEVITWFYHGGKCQRWSFAPR